MFSDNSWSGGNTRHAIRGEPVKHEAFAEVFTIEPIKYCLSTQTSVIVSVEI